MNKCLVFDLWGDYAHFRTIYATSSPLTYPFPPKPSLIGILSAITGLDKSCYLDEFYKSRFVIGVEIINSISKVRITENLYDVKNWKLEHRVQSILKPDKSSPKKLVHSQIRFEMLKDPKFRIYVWHEDAELSAKLKHSLINHSPHYTISLGLSENIANFEYIGEKDFELIENNTNEINVNGVLKKTDIIGGEIDFTKDINIKIYNTPVEMKQDREVTEYADYICEMSNKPLTGKISRFLSINNGSQKIAVL